MVGAHCAATAIKLISVNQRTSSEGKSRKMKLSKIGDIEDNELVKRVANLI